MRRKSLSLPLPMLSAYDPPLAGEGRLDPLGLASIADRLADTYAAPLRARMRRIRFASVMSLGAVVAPHLEGVPAAIPGDTAQLAFERLVVEALARTPDAARQTGIPGISKAQEKLLAGQRLDPRGYLKSPRVFGFHGIYRPFATAMGLLDQAGSLLHSGHGLLDAVERDQRLPGLADQAPGSPGGAVVSWLIEETRRSLTTGANAFSPRSPHVATVVALAAPESAGGRERRALRTVMNSGSVPGELSDADAFTRLLALLTSVAPEEFDGEPSVARYVARHGDVELKVRMQAVEAYEDFARTLVWAFDTYRWLATTQACLPSATSIRNSEPLRAAAARLPRDFHVANKALDRLADRGSAREVPATFTSAFSAFAEGGSPRHLIQLLMNRHETVQAAKPPAGKRAWFDLIGDTYAVRPMYTLSDEPERRETFVHPYRFGTVLDFLADSHE